ncbi:MAG: cytochrome ubiquinol oxidase subunit I, partial [Candidatus Dormibacteria bacterium]
DSYALTPGTAISAAHAMFSPSYPWLLLHYAGATLSWSALFLAAVAVWRGRRAKSEAEAIYQRWAARINFAIGSIFLMAQPITGFLLADTIKATA